MDTEWRTFSYWLCVLSSRPQHRTILLDAPPVVRRTVYDRLRAPEPPLLLADSSVTAWNLCEETGWEPDRVQTVAAYLKNPVRHSVVCVDGMSQLSLGIQNLLLQTLATNERTGTLVLGGWSHRVDAHTNPWLCSCRAGLVAGVAVPVPADVRNSRRSLELWHQSDDERDSRGPVVPDPRVSGHLFRQRDVWQAVGNLYRNQTPLLSVSRRGA